MTEACKGDEAAFAQWARDIVPETSQATYADDDATLTTESSYDDASSYGRDWLYADDRQAGDTAYFEADGNGYYVYYFIATSDNDYTTVNARQILVMARTTPSLTKPGRPPRTRLTSCSSSGATATRRKIASVSWPRQALLTAPPAPTAAWSRTCPTTTLAMSATPGAMIPSASPATARSSRPIPVTPFSTTLAPAKTAAPT